MTFTDLLALLALAALWVNTLLIVAHAGLEFGELGRRKARLVKANRGRVLEGAPLAEARTLQVGRSRGDGQLHFHDRAYESESFGGAVQAGEQVLRVPQARGDGLVEVWPDPQRLKLNARCDSANAFERLYPDACKARGAERRVSHALGVGDEVWVVPADADGPLWLSAVNPARWIRRQRALLCAFMLGSLALLCLCTLLVLWPPIYGTVSTLGGALSLAFFLLVQPVGATVSEQVRPLHRAVLRGRWLRPMA